MFAESQRCVTVAVRRCRHCLIPGMVRAHLLQAGELRDLVWLNPKRILRMLNREGIPPKLTNKFLVTDTNWECKLQSLYDSVTAVTMQQLLVEGREPSETLQYQNMLASIRAFQSTRRQAEPWYAYWCRTERDIDQYFSILLTACNDIRDNNYKTQSELVRGKSVGNLNTEDEIRVMIDSRGEPCLAFGGTHRLLAAQHFNIPLVPVIVERISYVWARKRLRASCRSIADAIQRALDESQ